MHRLPVLEAWPRLVRPAAGRVKMGHRLIATWRVCLRVLKVLLMTPLSSYYRYRLDLVVHRVPFPQDDDEFVWFCRRVRSLQPSSYLEIGSRHGGSLLMVSHYLRPGATVVCVDLPGADWGAVGSERSLSKVVNVLRRRGFRVTCFLGDSHRQETLSQVSALRPPGGFDVVFLDGDHTYEGILQDWTMYGSLGRDGGMVVFHDLVTPPHNPRVEVGRLFTELARRYRAEQKRNTWGLGVVYRTSSG